jgi:hypothetical protein
MELMARVADNIRTTGRGVILVLDFASETARVRVGDQIELKSLGGGASQKLGSSESHTLDR